MTTYTPQHPWDLEAPISPHSGLGITALVLSVLCGVSMFGLVLLAGIMEASTPGGINEESPEAIMLGLCILGGILLSFIGLGLGIAGLFQGNRKKLFAVLGVIFNGMIVFGMCVLMGIGMAMPA